MSCSFAKLPSGKAPELLLIEDNLSVATALLLSLELWGIAKAVTSMAGAAQSISASLPDIIITDYHTEGWDNRTAADLLPSILAERGFNGLVIVSTGDTSPSVRKRVEAAGWTLLVKPYEVEQLHQAMAEALVKLAGM